MGSKIILKNSEIIDPSRISFNFPIEIVKARKSDGEYYVDFIASDTDIDLHNERFTENAINDMVKYSKEGVELLKTHYEPFSMGVTVDGEVVDEGLDAISGLNILEYKGTALLDMNYRESQILWNDIDKGKNKRQLSVGGYILWEEEDAVEWEEREVQVSEKKKITLYILALNKFFLEHVAVTRYQGAANPRTGFVSAIMRSIDHNWMKSREIAPAYKSIDSAIKSGAISVPYNLGWLPAHSQEKIKTIKTINSEENKMDKTALMEELREKAKHESEERMKSLPGTHAIIESSTDVGEEKPVVVEETDKEKTTVEEVEKNVGETIIEIFKGFKEEISNMISKSEPAKEVVAETEEEPEKTEEVETDHFKELSESVKKSNSNITILQENFTTLAKCVQDFVNKFEKISTEQSSNIGKEIETIKSNIESVAKRVAEVEIGNTKNMSLKIEDSSMKSVEDVDTDFPYIFRNLN